MGTNSKKPIKMETDTYEAYVQVIKETSEGLLSDKTYVQPDALCTGNAVIPDYVIADHAAIDTIKKFMKVQESVVKLMNNVETNYVEEVDAKKTEELNNASGNSGG